MKTTINKEFFEKWKDKDVVMWCIEKEYAEEFCHILDEYGFKWDNSDSYKNNSCWKEYKEYTCYNFNEGQYDDLVRYEEEDYIILNFGHYIII